MTDDAPQVDSLLPYERWTEEALREVVVRALEYTAANGLPGEHHFYLTFRTDHPGVVVPGHLRARYPQEMTIVLQHRFWDLKVDRAAGLFSVGLSFGGVPSALTVPFAALAAFADPQVRYGLRFQPEDAPPAEAPAPEAPPEAPADEASPAADPSAQAEAPAQVVSLDAFRRRPPRE
ncbi:ClpXP protease specificity-enhancing factor SspB [Roseomonas sp. NAR14]|uniref:ClpXP protease specificity-enhancing factor SspB n=1 Tax=Roseomonas acroporae TaxID=2937791 RepID=A0A9X1Y4T6_9PROT|nr:ClpXP protease specificity-enhancing factor SspB [Roseomonas acroporae]MCK8783438.1 ClpXP protease specificity-enhancing factor SspB [Roseomonas acroporae]